MGEKILLMVDVNYGIDFLLFYYFPVANIGFNDDDVHLTYWHTNDDPVTK